MNMPGRIYNAGNYRYGFNGKEDDKDISDGGQDYGMRIYDTRLMKFLSVDPLTNQYPELTPYQFSSNNPIFNIDIDGLEGQPWYTYDPNFNKAVQQQAPIFYKNVGIGIAKSARNTVVGLWTICTHPGIVTKAFSNPGSTWNSIKFGLKEWGKELMSTDPKVSGQAVGAGFEFAAEMYIPSIVISKLKYLKSLEYLTIESKGIQYVWEAINATNAGRILGRGGIFEMRAWTTCYEKLGFTYVGQLKQGFFPYIDFWKDGLGISYKTSNATTEAGLKFCYENIDNMRSSLNKTLKAGTGEGEYLLKQAQMELGVPGGFKSKYSNIYESLKKYGEDRGVKVNITEIK